MTGDGMMREEGTESRQQMRCTAIVVAAGQGRRLGGDTPKQYRDLAGRPLFTYAYEGLENSSVITDLVLVVPAGDEEYAQDLLRAQDLGSKLRATVAGGSERPGSVMNGLEAVTWPCDVVYIQDGARPFPEEPFIRALLQAILDGADGAVAAVPAKDTIKVTDERGYVISTPDRRTLWQVQTPQVFPFALIRDVYREWKEHPSAITDDAMAAEQIRGARIRMVEASYKNIKVTTAEDLLIAEAFIAAEKSGGRG